MVEYNKIRDLPYQGIRKYRTLSKKNGEKSGETDGKYSRGVGEESSIDEQSSLYIQL